MGFLLGLAPGLPSWVWRWIGIGLVLVAAAAFGWVKRGEHDQPKYDALQLAYSTFKADVEAKGFAQEQHTKTVVAAQQQKTKEVQDDYAKKLAGLRSYYARRLRDATAHSGSGQVPPVPIASVPVDATPAYIELAGACAETTQQLVSLQEWVRQQQAANADAATTR